MPQDIRLWKLMSERNSLQEVSQQKLDLEVRLHKWLEEDISIISNNLLVIGSEVRTAYGKFIDLLCINSTGDLVIVELKKDKTPWNVIAQTLDYASWVKDLSGEEIDNIAKSYFLLKGKSTTLENEFANRFGQSLPEVLNASHGMLIVASSINDGTERIITYLSQSYGVDVNAITFQYFKQDNGDEMLARVFLLEPTAVEQANKQSKGSKKRPNLSEGDIEELLSGKGELLDVFCSLRDGLLRGFFTKSSTTVSSFVFNGRYSQSQNAAILSILVKESNEDKGLAFRVYTSRFAEHLGISQDSIISCLPLGSEPWQYDNSGLPEWEGHKGFFKSVAEVDQFLTKLAEVTHHGR
jgi:hypothetical protein